MSVRIFSTVALHTAADKELLESVQRWAINMISNLSGSYEQKLEALGLAKLEDSGKRGDMKCTK